MKLARPFFVLENAAAVEGDGAAVFEYADNHGATLRVDREKSIIHGVKIIGIESKNGRRYGGNVLAAAARQYEGAKVNVGHVKGRISTPREYSDRLGVLRNVEYRKDDGLYGDLHFNPKHAIAEQLAWDAENNPAAVGLSHAAFVRFRKDGLVEVAEEIKRVVSVDLVGDPATTAGLFEQFEDSELATRDSQLETPTIETVQALAAAYPELVAEITEATTQAIRGNVAAAVKSLLASQLPYTACDSGLIDSIIVTEEAAAREQIIAERLDLVKRLTPNTPPPRPGARPVAPPRQQGSGIKSAKEFAAAIK
jgi:hypothetical protein